MKVNGKRYQVFLSRDFGFGFRRLRVEQTDLALIYRWMLWAGWLSVRRWV